MINHKQKQKTILLLLLGVTLLLLTSAGATFAYFTANITGAESGTTLTVTGGSMTIVYSNGGNIINLSNISPKTAPIATKTFTVTGNNTMDVEMGYKISLVVTTNTFSNNAIQYKLVSNNTNSNGNVASPVNILTNLRTGAGTYVLGYGNFDSPTSGNKVHTYNLELNFPKENYNQNEDQGKEFAAHVTVENFDYDNIPFDDEKGVNKPVLFTGMTPVKWDASYNEIETTVSDSDWYDYTSKKWANAKTADGSYWVWIPRYAYKITSGYHSTTTGTIDIKFLKEETNANATSTSIETLGYSPGIKDTSMHHFLHPAFNTEGSELGFWVAKYEATAAEGAASDAVTCNGADNASTKTVKIMPNATSWRCINNLNAYNASLNMKTNPVYGWEAAEVDPHMLTNIEWGAVTYLSKSGYGADAQEIWNNSFNQYRTGCSATGVNANNESTCVVYNTENGVKASTTHNIYGVYDMSGGAWDRVMGNYNNLIGSSGFNTAGVTNIESKYIDRYTTKPEDLLNGVGMAYDTSVYGDAVYETSFNASRYNGTNWTGNSVGSWYGDASYIPRTSSPWFNRGGYWGDGTTAGPFNFNNSNGNANVNNSFRVGVRAA